MVPKRASQALRDQWRVTAIQTFGAAGIFEQEDGEHWTVIQQNLRGPRARSLRLNAQMGRNEERDPAGVFPGTTDLAFTEAGTRAFYRRWSELMQLAPPRRDHDPNPARST